MSTFHPATSSLANFKNTISTISTTRFFVYISCSHQDKNLRLSWHHSSSSFYLPTTLLICCQVHVDLHTRGQLSRDQLPRDQFLQYQLLMKSTTVRSTLMKSILTKSTLTKSTHRTYEECITNSTMHNKLNNA